MSKKKNKQIKPHVVIASELALEGAINRYVDTALSLVKRKAKQERELAALKAAHAAANRGDAEEILSLEGGITLYCLTHRKELLPDEEKAKSREFGNAILGFRMNPVSLAKIVEKDTWEQIAERLDALPWGEDYVDTELSVNKEMFHQRRADLTDTQLAEAGVKWEQVENFFIEPKSELLEAARKPVEAVTSEPSTTGEAVAA